MTGQELTEKVKSNKNFEMFPKGTEIEVKNSKNKNVGTLLIQRDVIYYANMAVIPSDLFISNYKFSIVE